MKNSKNHFNLLFIVGGNHNKHYCYIKDFSRLVRNQVTGRQTKMVFCKIYLEGYGGEIGPQRLIEHKKLCAIHREALPIMPTADATSKFENWGSTQKQPVVIYADMECIVKKITQTLTSKTRKTHSHIPMSYFYVKASDNLPVELLKTF